jgi:hypothetical protein
MLVLWLDVRLFLHLMHWPVGGPRIGEASLKFAIAASTSVLDRITFISESSLPTPVFVDSVVIFCSVVKESGML